MTGGDKLGSVIDVSVGGKQSDKLVDAAVVDEHAVVAMQSLNVPAQRVVRCVITPLQFAPL